MKYSPTEILTITLQLGEEKKKVGRMAMKDRRIFFEYDTDFIASGIEISPFKLPLKSGATTSDDAVFEGLFGVFNDSLPDGWGRLLLDRQVEKFGIHRARLTPLDRLAFVGPAGMGALSYEPELSAYSEKTETLQLDLLAKESKIVLEGEAQEIFEDLLRLNGSSSGAHPKIMAFVNADKSKIIHGKTGLDSDYAPWMIKFPSATDEKNIGSIEYAYSLMAKDAGIEMPETHLFKTKKKGQYFGVKRFDRIQKKRIHTHSLCGLIHADHRFPSVDYDLILKVTLLLTKDMREVEKAFRLACFNVFAHNRDDHSKNFSFILNENTHWKLSPAYDLTFSYGPGGEQSSTVMGEGKNPSTHHLMELGKKHGIKARNEVIDQVRASIAKWPKFAAKIGVSGRSIKQILGTIGKI